MSFTFRRAMRGDEHLIIVIVGGTGAGKTYTAMQLASGIAGGKPFAVIDTDAGRAKHYADFFLFDHGDLKPPFTPGAYAEAIKAADEAGYPVIVVDTFSHEWAGDGGVLEMHEAELDRMAGDNWQKREACKMAAWIKPKTGHKKMVQGLLQIRAHLILCLRAEEKVEMTKDDKGKTVITKKESPAGRDGWIPICEKNLPYEATVSFLLTAAAPGVPLPIKIQKQHRDLFPVNVPVTADAGRKVAEWAAGAKPAALRVAVESTPGVETGEPILARPVPAAPVDEALLIIAREFAECGTARYAEWWKALTPEKRAAVGAERHAAFKAIAEKVPA